MASLIICLRVSRCGRGKISPLRSTIGNFQNAEGRECVFVDSKCDIYLCSYFRAKDTVLRSLRNNSAFMRKRDVVVNACLFQAMR